MSASYLKMQTGSLANPCATYSESETTSSGRFSSALIWDCNSGLDICDLSDSTTRTLSSRSGSSLLQKRALYDEMDVDEDEASFGYKRPRYEPLASISSPLYLPEDDPLPSVNKKRKYASGDGTDEEDAEQNPSFVSVVLSAPHKRHKVAPSSPLCKLGTQESHIKSLDIFHDTNHVVEGNTRPIPPTAPHSSRQPTISYANSERSLEERIRACARIAEYYSHLP